MDAARIERGAATGSKHKAERQRRKWKSQGDHGRRRANYRCCLPALAGFVSPHSMGPGEVECGAGASEVQGETRSAIQPAELVFPGNKNQAEQVHSDDGQVERRETYERHRSKHSKETRHGMDG